MSALTVRHRYDDSDKPDIKEWPTARDDQVLTGLTVTFTVRHMNLGASFWWIKFTCAGKKYTCKENFYCCLTPDDGNSGRPVVITFDRGDMKVEPPASHSCQVAVYETT
ncbi:hypothetical protein [Actinomadura terrae]|uniref:hypothetical protein n=1 Tax=Actinomadura terrae TaxID=604353 RepID=UPI001FA796F5|nr:hypothetical protein [Actinomadura terrae]